VAAEPAAADPVHEFAMDRGFHVQERWPQPRIKVGSDLLVQAGERVAEAGVILGDAVVDGEVHHDLFVVSGNLRLNGKVNGDVFVVFGNAHLGPEASVSRSLNVVGGGLTSDGPLNVAGPQFHSEALSGFAAINALAAWAKSGPLLGRPLTLSVAWVWIFAAALLALHILVQLILPKPVQACVSALENRPIGSLFAGFLFVLLFAPVVVLLSVSVIGIALIPFLACGAVVAAVLGKIALYRFVGQQLGRQMNANFLQAPLIALIVGTALIYALYLVPVVGLLCWGVLSTIGLGCAITATGSGLRREGSRVSPGPVLSAGEGGGTEPAFAAAPGYPTHRVGFWARTLATALDLVLIVALVAVSHTGPVFPLVWAAYVVGMWTWRGATLGNIALGQRIVREDGRPITFAVASVRAISGVFSGVVLGLGFFWAGWSRDKQSWHDRIAGTCMVKVQPQQALV
jgi:uncharacterized RDD family membrane protein YckC